MTNKTLKDQRNIQNFGKNLNFFRKSKGLTIEKLSEAAKLKSSRIIYEYQKGTKEPTLRTLIAIADALDIDLDTMLL